MSTADSLVFFLTITMGRGLEEISPLLKPFKAQWLLYITPLLTLTL
jgi:hypothetical protein